MRLTAAERQGRYRSKRQAEIDQMPKISCGCGCNELIAPITKGRRPALYALGHNPHGQVTRFVKGQPAWNKGLPNPTATITHKGRKVSPEETARHIQARLANNGGVYTSPASTQRGIAKRPPEWRANVSAANRRRDQAGPNNPAWEGGISLLPYGPEFTRPFRRLIRERDGNRCQHCGKTAAQEREALKKALSVHHIDHDKLNNDPSNLVTTCNTCNVYFSHHRDESLLAFPRRRMLLR